MKTERLKIGQQSFSEGVQQIQMLLLQMKVPQKEAMKHTVSAEEVLTKLLEHGNGKPVRVTIRSFGGSVKIHMTCAGDAFDLANYEEYYVEDDDDYNASISHLMQKTLGNNISLSNRNGVNRCEIVVAKSQYKALISTMAALFAGLIVGMLLKAFVPSSVAEGISTTLFASVSNMFMNSLKMIVGPLVFFSMASSISDFTDLKAFGRIAGKIVIGYLFTSVIAIAIGYGVYQLFPIGDASLASAVTADASSTIATGEAMTVSIKDTIVNIIPSDFVSPFLKGDMLQIIFMAAMLGIGVAAFSDKYPGARKAVVCANDIFSKITAMIIGVMPVAVFCSMAKMVIGMDMIHLLKVATWVPVCYAGDLLMILAYCLLIFLVARLNPFKFAKAYFPVMLTAYSLSSSNAAMPTSIKCCEEKLGIAKRLYSFSIPLGATINMDGSCIMLMISSFFMAKVYGVEVTGSMLATLFISIMALSIGAPGVPGGGLVCLSILLPQIGVPAEAVSLVMGIYSLAGMGLTAVNVTGDAAVSCMVAKSEKLLNIEKYNAI